jgi:poly(3-hydroxybutyrate) depolymerase
MRFIRLVIVLGTISVVLMTGCPFIKSTSEQTVTNLSTADNRTSPPSQYNYTKSLYVNGLQRSYIVHLPISYINSRQWPLVIVLHGGGS